MTAPLRPQNRLSAASRGIVEELAGKTPANSRTTKELFRFKGTHNRHAGHAKALRQLGVRANRRKQAAKFRSWRSDYGDE